MGDTGVDPVHKEETSCYVARSLLALSVLPSPRYSLIVSICLAISFSLGLSLLPVAPVVAQSAPNPDYADALWITASTGLHKLAASDGAPLLHLTGETTLQPLALDVPRGQVWSYDANTLKAFSFAGQLVRTVPVPPVSGGGDDDDDDDEGALAPVLSVNPTTGSVWLGRGTQLHHLSATGTLLHNLTVASRYARWPLIPSVIACGARTRTVCRRTMNRAWW